MNDDAILAPCPGCRRWNTGKVVRKAAPIVCYYVKCQQCGRETPKHRIVHDAIRDWNLCDDQFCKEDGRDEQHGSETET